MKIRDTRFFLIGILVGGYLFTLVFDYVDDKVFDFIGLGLGSLFLIIGIFAINYLFKFVFETKEKLK